MNTKAQTPAANATTAKDDNKNANAGNTKVQFVAVTEKEDNDYQDLHSRHLDLTEEEEARYLELAKKIRAAKNARKAKIDEVKSDLRKMAFSIKDIFAAEDIKAVFQISDLYSQTEIDAAATPKKGGKAGNAGKKGSDTAKDDGWFKVEGKGNRPYLQGRLYQNLSAAQKAEKKFSTALGQTFSAMYMTHGDSVESLMKIATPKAKELFAAKDADFMAEVNDLVEAVRQHKASKGSGAGTNKKAA